MTTSFLFEPHIKKKSSLLKAGLLKKRSRHLARPGISKKGVVTWPASGSQKKEVVTLGPEASPGGQKKKSSPMKKEVVIGRLGGPEIEAKTLKIKFKNSIFKVSYLQGRYISLKIS